ncbi:MAG: serine/threonine protein kinase [Myxococcales bacterium]|nr:serine/threonine protein kinase [Myxococcales bacterium]
MKPGQRYGRFEILEHLGSGSFGHVYKVRDPRFDRPLALKLSLAPVTETEAAQRALREVAVLRTLTNPHAVRVYDCGLRRDGHVYVLMELLTGLPLDRWHDFDRPLAPAWACHVIHQCCLGLVEAHDRGIVHRDLKPANVFIDQQVCARVLDFGLARSWDDSSVIGHDATGSHMLVGTAHYAQPEQMRTMTLTPAADVYSLGMIFYELLTGHTPFMADRPVSKVVAEWKRAPISWMQAHTGTPVVPLSRHLPQGQGLDRLEALVLRMLEKDPQRRPPSARQLAAMVEAAWPEG